MITNLRVKALSPNSLLVTWDPPLEGAESLVGYSLVFVPVQAHQKRRTHVELFVSFHLHPFYMHVLEEKLYFVIMVDTVIIFAT